MTRVAVLLLLTLVAHVPVADAVTDCSRAKTNTEKLLCSNSRLAEADQRLAIAFREALNRGIAPATLMESQAAWNRDARDVCNDVECMLRAYEDRIFELDNLR